MKQSIEFIKKVVQLSNDFENENTDLKRRYFISNIAGFKNSTKPIAESCGTFGTGYPYYVLDNRLRGSLPVINEQIRYNNELATHADNSSHNEWHCAECLEENGETMKDLKHICKPCPNMDDELKPRKIINRLPDLDMWMVVEEKDIDYASNQLSKTLAQHGFRTSDIDPLRTIYDLEQIVADLKSGAMPMKKLPIDAHIIDRVSLYSLISNTPDQIDYAIRRGKVPYLPIHPYSLRKTWMKDEDGYNFVHDYLYGLQEFELDPAMQSTLNQTRKYIAEKYSTDTLYDLATRSGNGAVVRRNIQPEIRKNFEGRIESWREL